MVNPQVNEEMENGVRFWIVRQDSIESVNMR